MSNSQQISEKELDDYYCKSIAEDLGLTRSEFREILFGITHYSFPDEPAWESSEILDGLYWNDLLLARACARGYETAWNQFLILYRAKLYKAAAAMVKDDALGHELADSLYADLFGTAAGADGRRVSKLESYMGRGSLEGWLRTVLAQTFVNRFRTQRKLVSLDEAVERTLAATPNEPGWAAGQAQVEKATDAALHELSVEERLLLTVYYLDGRTLAQIGRMLALHESSVSRRLGKVTATLRKRIIAKLRATGISKREAEDLLQIDVRDLGVDVRRSLAQERQAGTF